MAEYHPNRSEDHIVRKSGPAGRAPIELDDSLKYPERPKVESAEELDALVEGFHGNKEGGLTQLNINQMTSRFKNQPYKFAQALAKELANGGKSSEAIKAIMDKVPGLKDILEFAGEMNKIEATAPLSEAQQKSIRAKEYDRHHYHQQEMFKKLGISVLPEPEMEDTVIAYKVVIAQREMEAKISEEASTHGFKVKEDYVKTMDPRDLYAKVKNDVVKMRMFARAVGSGEKKGLTSEMLSGLSFEPEENYFKLLDEQFGLGGKLSKQYGQIKAEQEAAKNPQMGG